MADEARTVDYWRWNKRKSLGSPRRREIGFLRVQCAFSVVSIPFDATLGRTVGPEEPLRADSPTWFLDLSPSGRKLAFTPYRDSKYELWVKSFEDNQETALVTSDQFIRQLPLWSFDEKFLAYERARLPWDEVCIVMLPVSGGDEQVLTSPLNAVIDIPCDWTHDGKWILASTDRRTPKRNSLVLFPIADAPHAEMGLRMLVSHSDYNLWDGRFSPDERWVCFSAMSLGESGVATLHVISREGSEWVRITEGNALERHPRWSPDGRTIYFVSNRTGFFNVWGIGFDPSAGKPLGQPFQVTNFESPSKLMASNMSFPNQISVAKNRLALSFAEFSGSIWILDNVDR